MKKHRIKNYLRLGILLFGISLSMIRCESEHIETEKTTNRYSVKRIYTDEIKKNKDVVNALGKFNDQQTENNPSQYSKEIYNSYYDFSIETDEAFYIEYEDYHSYTFNVYRNNNSPLTENLILSLQADLSYKVFLASYDLTEEEIELIRNHEYAGVLDKMSMTELEDFNTAGLLRSDRTCYEWGTLYVSQGTGWEIYGWSEVDCPEEIDAGDSSTGGGTDPDTSGDQDPLGGGGGSGGGGVDDDEEGNPPDDDEECILDSSGNCIENVTTPFPPKELNDIEIIDNCIEDFGTNLQTLSEADISAIADFITNNGCSEENQNFIEKAIEALDNDGIDDGEVDWRNIVILDDSFVDNEKAKCVYDKLKIDNSLLFRDTVGAFIDDPEFNLTFKVGNCNNTDDACTNAENPNDIIIIIEDTNQSGLGVAALILHEAVHAEIHRFVAQFESGVDINDRPRLFQLYAFYKGWAENHEDEDYNWTQDAHHQYMVENYVNKIASVVRRLDKNNYPLSHYIGYGWDGLTSYGYTSSRLTDVENSQNQNLRAIADENSQVCN